MLSIKKLRKTETKISYAGGNANVTRFFESLIRPCFRNIDVVIVVVVVVVAIEATLLSKLLSMSLVPVMMIAFESSGVRETVIFSVRSSNSLSSFVVDCRCRFVVVVVIVVDSIDDKVVERCCSIASSGVEVDIGNNAFAPISNDSNKYTE